MKRVLLCASVLVLGTIASFAETKSTTKTEDKAVASTDVIKGNWHILKGKIMKRWAKITNDDVLKMKGTREELRGELEKKYGYKKEEAEKEIDKFLEENK